METRDLWASTLKRLRESTDDGARFLLALVSNIPVSFTHDQIILTAPNKSTADILEKNRTGFGVECLVIRLRPSTERTLTTEEKLKNFFGENVVIE